MTSSLTLSEIPISQPYPDVIMGLRGLGLKLGLGLELRLGLGLRYPYSPTVTRGLAPDVIMLTSPLNKLRLIIFYL